MQDDVGFQSQVFNEQVANRRDRYAQQNIQTSQQMSQLPSQFMGAMRARQQMDLERQKVASELANDELHRQDAIQKLQWARELHTTDMIQMQRDAAKLDLDLKRAQVEKTLAEAAETNVKPFTRTSESAMLTSLASGFKVTPVNGRAVVVNVPKEESEWARNYLEKQAGGSGSNSPQSRLMLDLQRAQRVLKDSDLMEDEDAASEARAQSEAEIRRITRELRALGGDTEPMPAKAPPKPQESAQFKQRVKDFTVTDPGLANTIGAGNAEKLYTHILTDIDKYRAKLEKVRRTSLTDTEIASLLSREIQAGSKNRESQGYAFLQRLLQDGVLDPEEHNLATQRAETQRLRDADSSEMSLRAGF
jgi:hypothetical protein